jgi:hypothetical protein
MGTVFYIVGDPEALLAVLCPVDAAGFIAFGFSGRSRGPSGHHQLLAGSVEIIDYLLEGFVPYWLSAERLRDGIRLIVRKTGTNRDDSIDWFIEKYITSKGLAVTKKPV